MTNGNSSRQPATTSIGTGVCPKPSFGTLVGRIEPQSSAAQALRDAHKHAPHPYLEDYKKYGSRVGELLVSEVGWVITHASRNRLIWSWLDVRGYLVPGDAEESLPRIEVVGTIHLKEMEFFQREDPQFDCGSV